MDGWEWVWVWVCGGMSYAHMYAHTHARMHTRMHMHVKHDQHGCLHVGSHLQFLYMYTCACMWGHPPCPKMPPDTSHSPAPSPEPQGAQNTKFQ